MVCLTIGVLSVSSGKAPVVFSSSKYSSEKYLLQKPIRSRFKVNNSVQLVTRPSRLSYKFYLVSSYVPNDVLNDSLHISMISAVLSSTLSFSVFSVVITVFGSLVLSSAPLANTAHNVVVTTKITNNFPNMINQITIQFNSGSNQKTNFT